MRQLLVVAGCVFLLSGLTGCQDANTIDVTVGDNQPFPRSLAGRWRAYEAGWEFVVEPDGMITSAVIDSGLVELDPRRRTAETELQEEGEGFYELGPWAVHYSPPGRELSIEVVVDYFHLDMGTWGMKGNSTDLFVGPVSEDWQSWTAQWFSFTETTAFSKEKEAEEVVFRPDDTENLVDTVVFEKVPDQ